MKDINALELGDNINIMMKHCNIEANVKGVKSNELKERANIWECS